MTTRLATFDDGTGARVGLVQDDGSVVDLHSMQSNVALTGRTQTLLAFIAGGA